MKRIISALLALALILALAAGCSVKAGKDKIGKAMEATGEVKRDFVNAFFTSNLDGRYTSMRAAVSGVVAQIKPSTTSTDGMQGESMLPLYDYHLSLVPYATENCIDKLMANTNMNVMVDQYAAGGKLWLVPRDATFEKKETTADGATVYNITVVCEAYEDETQNYLYDVTYTGEMNTLELDGAEKVDRIYVMDRAENR